MTKETLCWAVFVAVLCPLILRQPADDIWMTVSHIGLCFALVGIVANWPARRG